MKGSEEIKRHRIITEISVGREVTKTVKEKKGKVEKMSKEERVRKGDESVRRGRLAGRRKKRKRKRWKKNRRKSRKKPNKIKVEVKTKTRGRLRKPHAHKNERKKRNER